MYMKPPKMSVKKKIEIAVLIAMILWSLLFLVNYLRFADGNKPLLAMHVTHKYDDGVTDEYISLGYIYRSYNRNSIKKEEFVPFWKVIENPKATPDLPVIDPDYNVPENPNRKDKFMGLVYFFDGDGLAGTYKCINSNDCNRAYGGEDKFNLIQKDHLRKHDPYKMETLYDKYAFIEDSNKQDKSKDDDEYIKTIYLYMFRNDKNNKPKILAKFADIKSSYFEKKYGRGDNHKYILKSLENNKWGVMKVDEDGELEEILPFEYDSITYDPDTHLYILCKDNKWFVYNINKKTKIVNDTTEPIADVWQNNNYSYYYKTSVDTITNNEEFTYYKTYKADGTPFVTPQYATEMFAGKTFIAYLTYPDSVLHFVDYAADERYKIQLKFSKMDYDEFSHPAFEVQRVTDDGIVVIKIYQGRETKYSYDIDSVNTVRWDLNGD